jgi:hypothetical protein
LREIIASRDLTTKFAEAFYRAILKEEGPFRFDVGNPDGPPLVWLPVSSP